MLPIQLKNKPVLKSLFHSQDSTVSVNDPPWWSIPRRGRVLTDPAQRRNRPCSSAELVKNPERVRQMRQRGNEKRRPVCSQERVIVKNKDLETGWTMFHLWLFLRALHRAASLQTLMHYKWLLSTVAILFCCWSANQPPPSPPPPGVQTQMANRIFYPFIIKPRQVQIVSDVSA